MPTFASYDGTVLAYHVHGSEGPPLICIPGGPGRASIYLGTLGNLDRHRQLIRLDNRGTGDSAVPQDPETYRWDRLPEDVEALRQHLGLERIDLLGHSAGAQVAVGYAVAYPERLKSLSLITGGQRALGAVIEGAFEEQLERRRAELPDAYDAMRAWIAAETLEEALKYRMVVAPYSFGTWNDDIARYADSIDQMSWPAMEGYSKDLVVDVEGNRAAAGALTVPVLVYGGDLDLRPTPVETARLASHFPNVRHVIQPRTAHYPWIDDPEYFSSTLAAFLS